MTLYDSDSDHLFAMYNNYVCIYVSLYVCLEF